MSKKGFYSTVGILALLGTTAAVGISVVMSRRNQEKKSSFSWQEKRFKKTLVSLFIRLLWEKILNGSISER